jgi:hypothetical protein
VDGLLFDQQVLAAEGSELALVGIPGTKQPFPNRKKRDFSGNYTWVTSPRWLDKRTGDHLALDGLVDVGYVKAPGDKTVRIRLPKTAPKPEVENRTQPMLLRAAIK